LLRFIEEGCETRGVEFECKECMKRKCIKTGL